MCRVKVYTKRCTTCLDAFKDRNDRDEVHVEQHPCAYVRANRMPLGGCRQRTRQERCGGMDWRECDKCVEAAWLDYGEPRRARSSDEDDGDDDNGNGGGYGMGGGSGGGGAGGAGGFGGDKEDDHDRRGKGGSGQGGKDDRGTQSISTRT